MVWGAIWVHGLSKLHNVPASEAMNANYHVTSILQKDLQAALNWWKDGRIDEWKEVQHPGQASNVCSWWATPHIVLVHCTGVEIIQAKIKFDKLFFWAKNKKNWWGRLGLRKYFFLALANFISNKDWSVIPPT